MAHLLNYKYEIFPTKPQKEQLYRILRQVRIQWNRAVTIRKKLKDALRSGQFGYVINELLSEEKNNNQGNRKKAIAKMIESYPNVAPENAPKFYDIKNIVGNILEDFGQQYLDIDLLVNTLKNLHFEQKKQREKDRADGLKKQTKLEVWWQITRAINQYAGYAANRYVAKSFGTSRDGLKLSLIRSNISGSAKSRKWNTAVQPSAEQRKYGATGEPRYKRRAEGFTYQFEDKSINTTILTKQRNKGHQVIINPLYKGSNRIDMAYHRPIPEDGKIKEITVSEHLGHFFVVFSVEVPEHEWGIIPMQAGWHAGIDPGAKIALTVGLKNAETNETRHLAFHYEFFDRSSEQLEKVQQRLALKQGPKRKRTEAEVKEALDRFSNKSAIRKMELGQREKAIEKEKARLESRMIRQPPSKAWRELTKEVRQLHYKIGNQRKDVLHKVSRALAEGCDMVAIGDWEPPREISYRKKLKDLKNKVKRGDESAKEQLEALKAEKTKQGKKGVKKQRRGGRDRSAATLKRLIKEKAERSGIVFMEVHEAGTTLTCSVCNAPTGPKGDLDVRAWKCENCNTVHHRDLNSGFNILKKAENAVLLNQPAAQAGASATEPTVARKHSQGAMEEPGNGTHATGDAREATSTSFPTQNIPNLWEGDVPKVINDLKQMGIISALSLQNVPEKPEK